MPLSNTVTIVAELRERLKAEFGLDDEDEALEDSLEGASDLNEQLLKFARQAVEIEAFAGALGEIIKTNQTRKARMEHKAEKLRGIIRWALSESGTKKVLAPDMTLLLSPAKAPLLVDDDAKFPDRLVRIKREPDKVAIRADLERGVEIAGARLGNPAMTLTIRRG